MYSECSVLRCVIGIKRESSSVQAFANELSEEVKTLGIPAEVIDMKDYDPDDQLADEVSLVLVLLFFLASKDKRVRCLVTCLETSDSQLEGIMFKKLCP